MKHEFYTFLLIWVRVSSSAFFPPPFASTFTNNLQPVRPPNFTFEAPKQDGLSSTSLPQAEGGSNDFLSAFSPFIPLPSKDAVFTNLDLPEVNNFGPLQFDSTRQDIEVGKFRTPKEHSPTRFFDFEEFFEETTTTRKPPVTVPTRPSFGYYPPSIKEPGFNPQNNFGQMSFNPGSSHSNGQINLTATGQSSFGGASPNVGILQTGTSSSNFGSSSTGVGTIGSSSSLNLGLPSVVSGASSGSFSGTLQAGASSTSFGTSSTNPSTNASSNSGFAAGSTQSGTSSFNLSVGSLQSGPSPTNIGLPSSTASQPSTSSLSLGLPSSQSGILSINLGLPSATSSSIQGSTSTGSLQTGSSISGLNGSLQSVSLSNSAGLPSSSTLSNNFANSGGITSSGSFSGTLQTGASSTSFGTSSTNPSTNASSNSGFAAASTQSGTSSFNLSVGSLQSGPSSTNIGLPSSTASQPSTSSLSFGLPSSQSGILSINLGLPSATSSSIQGSTSTGSLQTGSSISGLNGSLQSVSLSNSAGLPSSSILSNNFANSGGITSSGPFSGTLQTGASSTSFGTSSTNPSTNASSNSGLAGSTQSGTSPFYLSVGSLQSGPSSTNIGLPSSTASQSSTSSLSLGLPSSQSGILSINLGLPSATSSSILGSTSTSSGFTGSLQTGGTTSGLNGSLQSVSSSHSAGLPSTSTSSNNFANSGGITSTSNSSSNLALSSQAFNAINQASSASGSPVNVVTQNQNFAPSFNYAPPSSVPKKFFQFGEENRSSGSNLPKFDQNSRSDNIFSLGFRPQFSTSRFATSEAGFRSRVPFDPPTRFVEILDLNASRGGGFTSFGLPANVGASLVPSEGSSNFNWPLASNFVQSSVNSGLGASSLSSGFSQGFQNDRSRNIRDFNSINKEEIRFALPNISPSSNFFSSDAFSTFNSLDTNRNLNTFSTSNFNDGPFNFAPSLPFFEDQIRSNVVPQESFGFDSFANHFERKRAKRKSNRKENPTSYDVPVTPWIYHIPSTSYGVPVL